MTPSLRESRGPIVAFVAIFLCACGDPVDSSNPAFADGSGTPWPKTGIGLRIDSHSFLRDVDGTAPSPGGTWLRVDLSLANVDQPTAVPTHFALFSLTTQTGLQVAASVHSALLGPPCSPNISLTTGAQYTCAVVFDLPPGAAGMRLTYADPSGRTASAHLPTSPACLDDESWRCGACTQRYRADGCGADCRACSPDTWCDGSSCRGPVPGVLVNIRVMGPELRAHARLAGGDWQPLCRRFPGDEEVNNVLDSEAATVACRQISGVLLESKDIPAASSNAIVVAGHCTGSEESWDDCLTSVLRVTTCEQAWSLRCRPAP